MLLSPCRGRDVPYGCRRGRTICRWPLGNEGAIRRTCSDNHPISARWGSNQDEDERMKLQELIDVMEAIAPTRNAERRDNVGLLVGGPDQDVARAMLAMDYTPDVAQEAAAGRCDAVIAYPPPIFQPVKRITARGPSDLV